MSVFKQIEQSINALKQQDYIHLRSWFYQKDGNLWGKQLKLEVIITR
jgi:hypothetical protein